MSTISLEDNEQLEDTEGTSLVSEDDTSGPEYSKLNRLEIDEDYGWSIWDAAILITCSSIGFSLKFSNNADCYFLSFSRSIGFINSSKRALTIQNTFL